MHHQRQIPPLNLPPQILSSCNTFAVVTPYFLQLIVNKHSLCYTDLLALENQYILLQQSSPRSSFHLNIKQSSLKRKSKNEGFCWEDKNTLFKRNLIFSVIFNQLICTYAYLFLGVQSSLEVQQVSWLLEQQHGGSQQHIIKSFQCNQHFDRYNSLYPNYIPLEVCLGSECSHF